MENNTHTHLVIDNGSGMVKAGFSGEEAPRCVFPSIIGKPKYKKSIKHHPSENANTITYVGEEPQNRRGVLKLNYPIEHGIITNWDDMVNLWDYTFDTQLRINPKEHNVLLTEAPQNPKQNREKMMEIMFEKFEVPGSYVALQGVLSLYASGRTTGIVLDIGDGVTHTIPVFDGYNIPHAVNRFDLAGRDVTEYLRRLLEENGNRFITTSEKEIVRDIKEKFSYCAKDYDEEVKLYKTKNMSRKYTLPDGSVMTLNEEMFQCSEVLFDPNLIGKEIKGIHEAVYDSIQRTDMDVRKDLYSNVVLSGGTTMIKNIEKRLEKELNLLKPTKLQEIKVIAPSERKFSVWLGGSVLSSLETFDNSWITKREYEECGAQIIHMKCM